MKKNFLISTSLLLVSLLLLPSALKEKDIANIQIENADEMEAIPLELYIYINNSKYLLNTETNELTHITNY